MEVDINKKRILIRRETNTDNELVLEFLLKVLGVRDYEKVKRMKKENDFKFIIQM